MKRVLTVLVVSFVSLGCTFIEPEYKVTPSFTVHISNRIGPVAGLKLRATRPKDPDLSGLVSEELRARLTHEQVVRVEEAVTDANGDAHFELDRPGHWYLEPYSPAENLDYVSIYADAHFETTTVNLQWPRGFLETKKLQGRINGGIDFSRSTPMKRMILTLHDYVTLAELATTKTGEDGSFQFDGVTAGIYFLGMNTKPGSAPDSYPEQPEGYIPIYISSESSREWLSIAAENSTCGLSYRLEENKLH